MDFLDKRKAAERSLYFFVAGSLLTALVWQVRPSLLYTATDSVSLLASSVVSLNSFSNSSVSSDSGVSYNFTESDIEYLNRVYSEREYEAIYCGYISDGKVKWAMASPLEASPDSVSYKLSTCPLDGFGVDATLHTHPSGSDLMSNQDKKTFASQDIRLTCIQHGRISTGFSGSLYEVTCYEKTALTDSPEDVSDYSFDRVELQLAENS